MQNRSKLDRSFTPNLRPAWSKHLEIYFECTFCKGFRIVVIKKIFNRLSLAPICFSVQNLNGKTGIY